MREVQQLAMKGLDSKVGGGLALLLSMPNGVLGKCFLVLGMMFNPSVCSLAV